MTGKKSSLLPLLSLASMVTAVILLASPTPASASPTFAERMARADQSFELDYTNMAAKQEKYRAAHGRYWQGLPTHSKAPGAASASPDRWFDTPTDQRGQPWSRMIAFSTMPYALRVDTYEGPDGAGWVMCAEVTESGQVYERCQGDGAEMHDHAWQVVTP